jgi:hypothetical protein
LAAPLLATARQEFEEKQKKRDKEIAERELKLKREYEELAEAREGLDEAVAERLKVERKGIAEQEAKKARRAIEDELEGKGNELKELKELLEQKNERLAEAVKTQAELVKKERELEDAKREMDLTIQKRLDEELTKMREKVTKDALESQRLETAGKDKIIADMKKQVNELKRKAEQASQQLQGEVLELDLEDTLATKFPHDAIEPVPKGEYGGDVLQRVRDPMGQPCGTIIWETKRTKNWHDGWLAKLRSDQRLAKAEIAIIVSETLPKDISTFDSIDGVLVVAPSLAVPVAMVMRQQLIEIASTRQAGEGRQTKMELVYRYLTGPTFRQRVEAIVEAFSAMQDDLAKEKKVIMKQWSKRETQIETVMESTVGMWGDLQGIAGKTMQEIDGLDVQLLAADDPIMEEDT